MHRGSFFRRGGDRVYSPRRPDRLRVIHFLPFKVGGSKPMGKAARRQDEHASPSSVQDKHSPAVSRCAP